MGATTTDYRGKTIPATSLFNVIWWIYFVYVVLTTIMDVGLLLVTLVYLTRGDGGCSAPNCATVLLLTIFLGVILCLHWFALMWKDLGCMISLIVVTVISILFQLSMMRYSNESAPQQMTAPHLVLLIVSELLLIVLLSILVHEITHMG